MKFKIILIIVFAACFWGCEKNYTTETEIGRMESSFTIYLDDEYMGVGLPNAKLVDKGVCYSEKNATPTINDHVTYITDWSNDGTYMVKPDHLQEGSTYFYRTFIQKEDAIVYGEVQSFIMIIAPGGWVQKKDFAGAPRRCAVGLSIGNKGYVGTGGYANSSDTQDFWEFKP
jgi:hypothetical protein